MIKISEKKKTLVTSLRVNPDLWKEAKIQAIRYDTTLTNIVEEALKQWLKEKAEERGLEKDGGRNT